MLNRTSRNEKHLQKKWKLAYFTVQVHPPNKDYTILENKLDTAVVKK
jgi:hypothetical protein